MASVTQIVEPSDKRYLNGNIHIWRYVSLRTLFFYLNKFIFVPSIEKLRTDEPFEGEFYEESPWFNSAFQTQFNKSATKIREWLHNAGPVNTAANNQRAYFKFLRKTRFAWCWFQSEIESAAMWNTYGNQGVAIQSTVGNIAKTLRRTNLDCTFGPMKYVDYRGGISLDFDPIEPKDYALLLRPHFLKRKEYKCEEEVRFVMTAPEQRKQGILLRNIKPDWITQIRLWPKLTTAEEQTLVTTIRKFLPKVDCEKSDLFGKDDWEAFETMYGEAPTRWFNQMDSIPSELKLP